MIRPATPITLTRSTDGNGEPRYLAMIEGQPPEGITGCPLGRSSNHHREAIVDLMNRIWLESNVIIDPVPYPPIFQINRCEHGHCLLPAALRVEWSHEAGTDPDDELLMCPDCFTDYLRENPGAPNIHSLSILPITAPMSS